MLMLKRILKALEILIESKELEILLGIVTMMQCTRQSSEFIQGSALGNVQETLTLRRRQ